mgnify:FL=1
MINLLADPNITNHLLAPFVCQFLRQTYFSVEIWGVDKEILEVGWMIANLIGQEVASHLDPKDVAYLLEWIE